jgi:hypothetical protein
LTISPPIILDLLYVPRRHTRSINKNFAGTNTPTHDIIS